MAPLPSNTTAVLFVDYTVCGEGHTLQLRYGTGATFSTAMTVVDNLLTAMASLLRLITITGARVRDLGSNVTYPVTWSGSATYGSGAGTHNESAYYFDFIGRSVDGRRVRIAIFGAVSDYDGTNNDFRLNTAESTPVANAFAALTGGSDVPVSISGLVVSWHTYANMGANAYWRNRIR